MKPNPPSAKKLMAESNVNIIINFVFLWKHFFLRLLDFTGSRNSEWPLLEILHSGSQPPFLGAWTNSLLSRACGRSFSLAKKQMIWRWVAVNREEKAETTAQLFKVLLSDQGALTPTPDVSAHKAPALPFLSMCELWQLPVPSGLTPSLCTHTNTNTHTSGPPHDQLLSCFAAETEDEGVVVCVCWGGGSSLKQTNCSH